MSRDIRAKIKISANLVADLPISIGGGVVGEMVDIDLARDGQGRFYIPGSSLAGPMSTWVEMNLSDGEFIVEKLFGYRKKNKGDTEGYASCMAVGDAVIRDESAARERRHGISIRKDTGTAKDGFFYTRALLPRGTSFNLEMEMDVTEPDGKTAVGALKLLLEAMEKGDIRFGSCKTRGFGAMSLRDIDIDYYDFSGQNASDNLDKWLNGENSDKRGLETLGEFGDSGVSFCGNRHRYELTINWAPRSRIMVKSGKDGIETNMLPLVSASGEGVLPVIPGSSIKGALRSQACRIIKTMFGDIEDGDERFGVVSCLFGDTTRSGLAFINDVYLAADPVSKAGWMGEDWAEMNRVTLHEDHVAIDRFTGGASEEALYSARPTPRTVSVTNDGGITHSELCWDPIRITVDFSARKNGSCGVAEKERLPALALLFLLIKDLKNGLIPLGFGTNRGFGEIEINTVEWGSFPHEQSLKEAWINWVNQMTEGRQQ
ncbi:MAG: RAMP superfamily CRISPR-associated protein [Synergistaceae bacterium]|nr:RAMP superfamily CRISPR-associated protein [Synergistaceae bacterium]